MPRSPPTPTGHNYHRLHGELGWRPPAERFDGTPFTDRGFEHVPALAPVADLLAELLAQAALGSRIVTGEIQLAAEIAPPAWRKLRTRGG